MNHNTRFFVRAIISNGTELTFHSDSIMSVGAWKEGVSETAALFSEGVQFVLNENENDFRAVIVQAGPVGA